MPNNMPFIVHGIVRDSSDDVMSNVRVTVRNERTNETHYKDTNTLGEYVIDLANLTSGYATGDICTVFCLYTNQEDYEEFSIGSGGVEKDLTLTDVPASDTLVLFTVQDFYDTLNLTVGGEDTPNTNDVVKAGKSAEDEIERRCNMKFDTNSSSYHSTTGYLDTSEAKDTYFLPKVPIATMTTLATTQSSEQSEPDYDSDTWSGLTENTDYLVDTITGRLIIVNSAYQPIIRKNGIYYSYTHGQSTPNSIRMAAILLTAKFLTLGTVFKALTTGNNSFTFSQFTSIDEEITKLLGGYTMNQMSNT